MDFTQGNKDCAPDILEIENKFHSADFNCNNCTQTDCIYWILYNGEITESKDFNQQDI